MQMRESNRFIFVDESGDQNCGDEYCDDEY